MPFKGFTHNFMPHMVYLMNHHIIDGSKGNFGKICSITNAYVKGSNRCFGYFLGFSWLWGHFEGLGFGVQGTIFGVCGGEKRCFASNLGGSKSICFNDSFSQPPIKVWKKSRPLQQHTNSDIIIREMFAKKKGSKRNNKKFFLFFYTLSY